MIHQHFKILGESTAYQPLTCAEDWANEDKKHTIDTGQKVFGVKVDKVDGSLRVNYYCEKCYMELKKEHEEWINNQPKLL